MLAEITQDELNAKIPSMELANGLLNRFLVVCAKRSKVLPFGGALRDADLAPIAQRLRVVIQRARTLERVEMTTEARVAWAAWYRQIPETEGLLGAATARAEAQTLRIALIYSVLDGAASVNLLHLRAAFAFWDYCYASALVRLQRR